MFRLSRRFSFGALCTASFALAGAGFVASAAQTKSPANFRPAPAATTIVGNASGPLLYVENDGTSAFNTYGVMGATYGGPDAIGVLGYGGNTSTHNLALVGADVGPGSIAAFGFATYPEASGGPTASTQTTGVLGSASNGDGVMGETYVQHGCCGIVPQTSSYGGVVGVDATNNGGLNSGVIGKTTNGLAGVQGIATTAGSGVWGTASSGDGVVGYSSTGLGVQAISQFGFAGVTGYSPGNYGVIGMSDSGVGLMASSTGDEAIYATAQDKPAIEAFNTSITRASIEGSGGSLGIGLYGTAGSGGVGTVGNGPWGVVGSTSNGISFLGVATSNSADLLDLFNYTSTSPVAVFYVDVFGNVNYYGSLNSFVNTRDGNVGRMFVTKSTMQTMEDFGSGTLVNGSGTVHLDPSFAQMMDGAGYQVFLTPNGDNRGLYVAQKTPNSFVVRESQSGRSTLSFDYRIVARQYGHASDHASVAATMAAFGARPVSSQLLRMLQRRPVRDTAQLQRDRTYLKQVMSAPGRSNSSSRSSYDTFAPPRAASGFTLNLRH